MNTREIKTRQVKKEPEINPINPSADDAFFAEASSKAPTPEEQLSIFINGQIDKMKSYTKLGNGGEPTFYEVNEALIGYQDTLMALLALHNTAKIEFIRAKEAFDDWYADKYILLRDDLNPRSLSSQKWYSQKEIEMQVRKRYNDDYKRLSWNVSLTEQQLSFMRRMLDGWSSHQYVLTQLSKNLIAEVNGMGVEGALSRGLETN